MSRELQPRVLPHASLRQRNIRQLIDLQRRRLKHDRRVAHGFVAAEHARDATLIEVFFDLNKRTLRVRKWLTAKREEPVGY
jgi:hypothetical protein